MLCWTRRAADAEQELAAAAKRAGHPGLIGQIRCDLLADLRAGGSRIGEPWADLVADIAAQYARGDGRGPDLDFRSDARTPAAALRRHTEIRDRTCTFVGCRHRAHTADQDHARDYHRGGATIRSNLGPLCAHDHRVKHPGGWRVDQPEPGLFSWRSPLGGEYRATPEPFLPPMPDPVRRPPPRGDPGDPPF